MKYEFHDTRSMLSIANKKALQADEKPLYVVERDDGDTDFRLSRADENSAIKFHARELDDFKAVYNPESGRIFGAVTSDYDVVNPPQFLGPLTEELVERERNPTGAFWVREDGAKVYGRVLLDDHPIYLPGRGEQNPVHTGVEVRWSHDGGVSVSARGFAQDTACSNSMRRITDSMYVKHSGDVKDRVDFREEWDRVLNQLGAFSETLANVIERAMNDTLLTLEPECGGLIDNFGSDWIDAIDEPSYLFDRERGITPAGPFDERDIRGLFGLYDYAGLPAYLAVAAAGRLQARMLESGDELTASAWDAYSAGTWALTHESRATPGSGADDDHHRAVNELLMNPPKAVDDARREVQRRLAPDDEQAPLTVGNEDIGEALQQYQERENELRATFSG